MNFETGIGEFEGLRDAIGAVLKDKCSLSDIHEHADGKADISTKLWKDAADLGWLGISMPECYGGGGMGQGVLAIIYEELGRCVAPIPFLQTMLCAQGLLLAGSTSQKDTYLPRIIAGDCVGAVASLPMMADGITVTKIGSMLKLKGTQKGILSSSNLQLLLVFAKDKSGKQCALIIDLLIDGVELTIRQPGDVSRALGTVCLDGIQIPENRLLDLSSSGMLTSMLLSHACMALACDSSGGAEAVFDLTLDYLKTRRQFGRAIGSFQAIKHRCADLKTILELSQSSLNTAVDDWSLSELHSEVPLSVHMAKFISCDSYAYIAADAVQLHGGIGFTWDYHCHLFLKRAKLNQQLFGSSEWHQDMVGGRLVANSEHVDAV